MKVLYKCGILLSCLSFKAFANFSLFDMVEYCNSNNKYGFILESSFMERELSFDTVEKEEVILDLEGRTFRYFGDVYKDYKIFFDSKSTNLSFIFKFYEKVFYKFKLGIIEKVRCNLSLIEEMKNLDYGMKYGISMGVSLFPSTIVSDSILICMDNSMLRQNFDFLTTNEEKYKVDTDLIIYEISLGIGFSKIITKFMNFNYGFVLTYKNFSVIDRYNYYEISGIDYSVSIHAGSTLSITKKEKINFEISISLRDEINLSYSFLITF